MLKSMLGDFAVLFRVLFLLVLRIYVLYLVHVAMDGFSLSFLEGN